MGKDTTIYELTLKCVDGLEVTKKVELSLQTDKTERETYNFKLGLQYLKIKGKLIITHTHNEIEIPVFREFRNEKDECPSIESLSVEDHTKSARSAIALSHYLAEYILDMVECGKACF